MLDDLKTALRALRASPTFTIVALVVLALGIGAGTAIFSIVDAVVLRGLPFDEHDRLAAVLEHDTKRPTTFGGGQTTSQTYLDWRRLQESFDGLAAVGGYSFRLRNESGEPADARAQRVSWEFFPVVRVAPILGRSFTAQDEIEGRHRVAILSYGLWQRRFGGSPDAIGKTLELNEETWEIVGVLPRGFAYPVASDRPTEIYAPLWFRAEDIVHGESHNYNWTAIGRLKKGISLAQAHDQMNRVSDALEKQHPKWSPGRRVRVIALQEHLVGKVRPWMLMLLGAVVIVLLIACANVGNLMLARATVRTRELGIRAALGASRWRLTRALLIEGIVLSLAGAAIGIVLAYGGVQLLRAWLPTGLPRVASIGIDLRVLITAVCAALLTGVFFGIVPALQSSRPDLTTTLKDSSRSSTAGTASQRLRGALVVAEVALAVVLLVGAGLFTRSFVRLMRVDTGLDYHNVLVLNVGIRFDFNKPGEYQRVLPQGRVYLEQMVQAVSRVPGVEQAAVVGGGLPLTGSWSRTGVELPGRGELKGDDDSIDIRTVTPKYLELLRIPLFRGRTLSTDDRESGVPVVVVNQTAATKYWPGQDPLGQHVKINNTDRVVVGVVGDIRHLGPETPPRQECYVPLAQNPQIGATLAMRTRGDPLAVLPAVKAAIWSVNKDQRLTSDTLTMEAYMDRLIAQRRFNMALLSLFGVLGLVIAAVGIYGVMAYLVAQRTNEIGVRMALGATRSRVVSMVLRRAATLMLAGLAIGVAGAWYLGAGIATFLYQIEPTDLSVFGGALLVLACAGLLASAIPAHRAATVDPLIALRHE
jgi:putative ABC transport system permease protein